MKKTVFILTMLFGTAFAFGQKTAPVAKNVPLTIVKETERLQTSVFENTAKASTGISKSSFFKKAVNVLYETTFSGGCDDVETGYTTNHTLSPKVKGSWFYIKDTIAATYKNMANCLNETNDLTTAFNFITADGKTSVMSSETRKNGYIGIFPVNNVSTTTIPDGKYDSYVQIKSSINTTTVDYVNVEFYQEVDKFVKDTMFLEWSTDQTSWNSININTSGVEKINDVLYREHRIIPLPKEAGRQGTLYIRFRYASIHERLSPQSSGGYYWLIDDLKVVEAPKHGASVFDEYYYEGGYHIVPYGLRLPNLEWKIGVSNIGQDTLVNTKVQMVHYALNTPVSVANIHIGEVTKDSIIRGKNTILRISDTVANSGNISLPTTTSASRYFLASILKNDSLAAPIVGDSVLLVTVNGKGHDVARTFARDNGVFLYAFTYCPGKDPKSGGTTYNKPANASVKDYTVCLRYGVHTNPDEVNQGDFKDGVWINGVELVPSVLSKPGARIRVLVYQQYTNPETGLIEKSEYVGGEDEPYVIKSGDISPAEYVGFTPKTVRIPFIKERIKMITEPGYSYLACYQLVDAQTEFWVSHDVGIATENLAYSRFGFGDTTNLLIRMESGAPFTKGLLPIWTPMVRLFVGPKDLGIANAEVNAPSFSLTNYPNPAKDRTTISYTLVDNTNVIIEVRDLMGRVLKSIPQGMKMAGQQTYELVTSDLPNGTYFYSVNVNGSVQTKKLVISK